MSDLSFLIENQNEVQIDESFLEKCQNNKNDAKQSTSNVSRILSSKEIKLNKFKNLIATKKKSSSPRSFNMASGKLSDELEPTENQFISKISMRVQALEENQKNMQKKIGVEFFNLKSQIQKRNVEQNQQFDQVRRIKANLHETKKSIAELLNMITKKKN